MNRKSTTPPENSSQSPEAGAPVTGLLRVLLSRKMGIAPGVLRGAPAALAARFATPWAPAEELAGHLRRLPAGALRFLAGHPRGYLIVDAYTRYEPAETEVQGRPRANVVHVHIADLADPLACLSVAGELLDHLLGCHGAEGGLWLSDGGGITPEAREVGRQVGPLYDLGYGVDEPARRSRRTYLARSLAWYVTDRARLNVADPLMERLLKRSLMAERFWECLPSLEPEAPDSQAAEE